MIKCCLCSYCVMVFVEEDGQPVNCKLMSGPDPFSGLVLQPGSRDEAFFLALQGGALSQTQQSYLHQRNIDSGGDRDLPKLDSVEKSINVWAECRQACALRRSELQAR